MNGSAGSPNELHAHHLAAERWVIGLTEPLLPAQVKLDAERALAANLGGSHAVWTVAFCSVFLHGLSVSLPEDDPWRRVRYFVPDGPQHDPVEQVEGGWAAGESRPFGQVADVVDITVRDHDDNPDTDFVAAGSLMTVPGWWTASASALVGAAASSWRDTFWAVCAQLGVRSDAEVFADITRAASALLWRRRTYLGRRDEELPLHLGTSMAFADRVASRMRVGDLTPSAVAAAISEVAVFDEWSLMLEAVPAESWSAMRIDWGVFDEG